MVCVHWYRGGVIILLWKRFGEPGLTLYRRLTTETILRLSTPCICGYLYCYRTRILLPAGFLDCCQCMLLWYAIRTTHSWRDHLHWNSSRTNIRHCHGSYLFPLPTRPLSCIPSLFRPGLRSGLCLIDFFPRCPTAIEQRSCRHLCTRGPIRVYTYLYSAVGTSTFPDIYDDSRIAD